MAKSKIATAYVQVIPSMAGVAPTVKKYFGAAGNNSGSFFGSNFASALKSILVSAGIGEALKASLTEGAALEQSLGGVETMFRENADAVIANAQQAYRTAGMSANSYMEQVTSFSASLLQSLSGDTAAAASVADMALTDMSDNANKFGTDMERITDAYQGFAKQNYTMLDNLKLGYGGTKAEMERLLADAQKLTGIKYDINNLADVYSAIHAIQEELEITGTTAGEASTTLTGSFNSMKAAFSDVMGNLALGFDLKPSLNALSETTVTFLQGNFIPAVKNIVTALPNALSTFISGVLPANMTGTAVSMINNLASGLDSAVPQLLSRALPMVTEFTGNLRSNAGMLVDAGLNLISNLGQGLINALPTLISNVPHIITNICGVINDNAPKLLTTGIELILELGKGIIQAGPIILENIPSIIESILAVFSAANWMSLGSNMIKSIGDGAKAASPSNILKTVQELVKNFTQNIQTNLPTLVQNGTQMINNLVRGFISGLPNFISSVSGILQNFHALIRGFFPTVLNSGVQVITNLVTGLISAIPSLLSAASGLLKQLLTTFISVLPSIMTSGASMVINLASGILSNLPAIISSGTSIIAQLLSTFASHLPDLLAQGISLIGQLVAGLISMIPDVISSANDIITNIQTTFGSVDWLSIGSNIISGIASGIANGVGVIIEAAKSAAMAAYEAAKSALGIKSPSRLFRKAIGYMIPAGAALGITDGIPLIRRAMNSMSDATAASFNSRLRVGTQLQSSGGTNSVTGFGRMVTINQYIYSKAQTAADLMQEARYQAETAVLLGV